MKDDKSIIWTSSPSKETSTEITEIKGTTPYNEEDITVLTLPEKPNKTKGNARTNFWLKPVLIATLSAVLLGFFLGGVTLKVFGVMSSEDVQVSSPNASKKTLLAKEEKTTKANLKTFMIQGGVFTKQKNADEWLQKYKTKQIPTFLWERDGTYHLFAGMALNKDEAAQKLEQFKTKDFDVFVKEWKIKKGDLKLTKKQDEWLNSLLIQWNESVELNNSKDEIELSKWESLLKKMPKDEDTFAALQKEIETFIKDTPNEKSSERTISLIKLAALIENTLQ